MARRETIYRIKIIKVSIPALFSFVCWIFSLLVALPAMFTDIGTKLTMVEHNQLTRGRLHLLTRAYPGIAWNGSWGQRLLVILVIPKFGKGNLFLCLFWLEFKLIFIKIGRSPVAFPHYVWWQKKTQKKTKQKKTKNPHTKTATFRLPQMKQYTASKGGRGLEWEHYIILTTYKAVYPTVLSGKLFLIRDTNNSIDKTPNNFFLSNILPGLFTHIISKRTK